MARSNGGMKPSTRDFWRELLSWPKRKRIQFTVRLPLWIMIGVAICGSLPYWGSMSGALVLAFLTWAFVGVGMELVHHS